MKELFVQKALDNFESLQAWAGENNIPIENDEEIYVTIGIRKVVNRAIQVSATAPGCDLLRQKVREVELEDDEVIANSLGDIPYNTPEYCRTRDEVARKLELTPAQVNSVFRSMERGARITIAHVDRR